MHPLIAAVLLLVAGIGVMQLALPRPALALPASLTAVLLGLLLGPALGILDGAALTALTPVAALGAGWIGAAFGARLEWRMMRRVPLMGWARGAALAVPVFVLTGVAVWGLLRLIPALGALWHGSSKAAILTLAAAATVSTGFSRAKAARRAGLFDTMLAALAATAALASAQSHPARALVMTLVAGGVPAALWLLVRPRHGLSLAAVILLSAGLGQASGASPFVVCALLTALIVSFGSPEMKRFVGMQLAVSEPVVYTAFLIVVAALVRLPTPWLLALGLVLALLRSALRWATVRFGKRLKTLATLPAPQTFVTVGQGAAAVAIAAGFDLVRGDGAHAVLTTVLVSVLVADALAAILAPRPAVAAAPLTASPRKAEVS